MEKVLKDLEVVKDFPDYVMGVKVRVKKKRRLK